jgi:trehalose 6-phosphate synthase
MPPTRLEQRLPAEGVAPSGSRDLVVVANRLPVRRISDGSGDGWERSPGGLVAGLEPAVNSSRTTWIGWSGTPGARHMPFTHGGIALHPVEMSRAEEAAFYGGFSNSTLWPLYHDAIVAPRFRDDWWQGYVAVNQRFADRAAAVAPPAARVWIHDYQLQLVPAMLRQKRDDLRIGFFLHIPFPAQELYLRLPWRVELTRGMLGADVVGFQTVVGAENFRQVARRLLGTRVVGGRTVIHADRRVHVGTFPVGIDAQRIRRIAAEPGTIARSREIRADLGHPRTILLGVDRLDYTKGIEVRLRAYRELLEERRIDPENTVLVQIAQPSRHDVHGYAETRRMLEQVVGRINGDFGRLGGTAVKYLHQSQSLYELIALYRSADVMLVTPLRDGMNLVAKEYVASRVDHSGILLLSEFAGAAHQLHRAVLVNPFDVKGLKDAIDDAVNGDRGRYRRRMISLSRVVDHYDADRWAREFLAALEAT